MMIFLAGFGVGIMLIDIWLTDRATAAKSDERDTTLLIAIAIILATIYAIYKYIENAPAVIIDCNSIYFNGKEFKISDIADVSYSGRQKFGLLLLPSEGMKMEFIDGDIKRIFDSFYTNSHLLKQSI
ncbi:MAG: hypothetical protein EOO45_16240, partial [Flavobacterium sp.]